MNIGFFIFPGVTLLDMAGAAEPLGHIPGARLHLVWKDTEPVRTDKGLTLVPSVSFEDCPQLDILCVPGGMGQMPHVFDRQVQDFLRRQAKNADWIASICTGSFFLAAAGLLDGYDTTCHWAFRHKLAVFGVTVRDSRVVVDGNRIAGAGVTSGIDLGLVLAARIAGDDIARLIQLTLEYDPQPPFDCGNPSRATDQEISTACAALSHDLPPDLAIDPDMVIVSDPDRDVA